MVTKVVVLFATLWVDLCLAHYSLYISEENLQSYYSNSAYVDLIQGQFVPIVDDGEVLIGDGGALLLIEVTSGSGVSGSGYSLSPVHDVTGRSLDYSSMKSLPPFPAHVDTVNFTWISKTMVNFTLRATQEGDQLWNPSFGVPSTGLIPRNLSSLQMRVQCRPLAMETGRVHFNLTTVINQSEALVYFFLDKSCNDTVMPSLSTVIQASVTQELNSVTSHSLPFSLSVLLMTTSQVPVFSPTPTVHPHPLASTPILATPGPVVFSSPTVSSVTASFLSHTPVLVTDMPSPSSLPTGEPSLSSLSVVSTAVVSPYPSSSSIHRTLPPLVELSSSLISTSLASLFLSTLNISPPTVHISQHSSPLPPSTTLSFSLSTFNPSPLASSTLQISPPLYPSTTISLSTSSPTIMSTPLFQSSTLSVEGFMSTSAIVGNSSVGSRVISTAKFSSSILLTIPGPGDSSSQLLILVCAPIGGILVACILLSLCLVVCFKFKTSKKRAIQVFSDDPLDMVHTVPYSPSAVNEFTKKAPPPLSLWMSLPWGYVSSLPRSLQTLVTQLGVDRKSLSIIDTISRGECGSVVSGQLNNIRTDVMSGSQSVIIKMLTGFPEGGRRDEVVRFLEASTLMKGIKHQNILSVLRVSVEDNHVPLVVYPMVEHCDMYRVIKLASDPEHSVLPPLTVVLTLELAIQIATAMNYLGEHSIVHPDLALRNCVLDSGCRVKVSDGALAQQFHPECYYTLFGATRPVRWAAVETLQEGLCTVRSNVWSYAVTVWEILTFAEMPYSEVNNNRSILSTIKMGARLPRPSTCSEELYTLLCTCWNERGEERPSFKTLISHLKHLLSQLSNEHPDGVEQLYVRKRNSSNSIGKSVSRDRLSHGSESPRSRNHNITFREASMGSLKRVSMASMMSRGSTAEKLSVTFSVLSGADASGSDSEDEANQSRGLELQNFTDQQEIRTILRQVSTSFIDSPVEKVRPQVEVKDEANSSVHTTMALSDISSCTLVPPPLESPVRSPKLCIAGDETSLASSNPVSLTPPPSQTVDSQSKTSTTDLESVSTAPYTSSPLHGTAFLYPSTFGSGFGVMSNSERGDQSPLVVGHRAHSRTSHSPALLPSQPSAKSTDSGIRSDEDSEATHSPNTSMQYAPKAIVTNSSNVGATSDGGMADFSSSLFAVFDTWDNT